MPGNAFIRFLKAAGSPAFPGESMQKGHFWEDGWLEINDWSWDIEADTNYLKGSGAAIGKPKPGNLTVSHSFDRSSTHLLNHIVMGTHFFAVQIHMLKQANNGQQVFFELMGGSVFVNKVGSKAGEDGNITQDVELTFKEIAVGYKRQHNSGDLESVPVTFGWNIAAMNTTLTSAVKLTI